MQTISAGRDATCTVETKQETTIVTVPRNQDSKHPNDRLSTEVIHQTFVELHIGVDRVVSSGVGTTRVVVHQTVSRCVAIETVDERRGTKSLVKRRCCSMYCVCCGYCDDCQPMEEIDRYIARLSFFFTRNQFIVVFRPRRRHYKIPVNSQTPKYQQS
jgi:hypothetical protein